MRALLITTENQTMADSLKEKLGTAGAVEQAPDIENALSRLQERVFNVFFLDLDLIENRSRPKDFINVCERVFSRFWEQQPTLEIVVITRRDHTREAVSAVKAGANNYLTFPFEREEVKLLLDDIYEGRVRRSELDLLRDQFWAADAQDDINTQSDVMRLVLDQIKSVAPTRSTVLLSGETGTGKTRLAKLIHRHSRRKEGPFISINCGAIPDTLFESELFGHEKGAFTGAIRLKLGKFEIAKGGTLFLDEIGTISTAAQVKLLTVIQDGEFQRVGGEVNIPTDIRLIAATNTNLARLVEDGQFRKDLYYRLNVFPIAVPRLADRREDITLLVTTLIQKFNVINNKSIKGVHPAVLSGLLRYSWPGNIRELENLIERAHILESTSLLTPESFPPEIGARTQAVPSIQLDYSRPLAEVRRQAVEETERRYLKELLNRHRGKITPAAAEAGVTPRQLNKLLHKFDIRKEDYKNRK